MYPAPRRAASAEPVSPCTGRGLASRRVTTALVGSYPTFSPLPSASPESFSLLAVSFLCHFPSAFAAWGFPSVLPFGVRTFLEPRTARGHPACRLNCSRVSPLLRNSAWHSGHEIVPARWRTNSPQTRHSRLAPRRSANSSCSSVRLRASHRSQLPEDSDHLAEHLDVLRRRWARARRSRAGVGRGRLRGRSASPSPRRRSRRRRRARRRCRRSARPAARCDDDEVAVEDARVDHRVALDAQQELLAPARERLGHREVAPRRSPRRAAAHRRRSRRRAGAGGRPTPRPRAPSARGAARSPAASSGRADRPARSRFARCAWTVEGDARPTASPISRTVGGYPCASAYFVKKSRICRCRSVSTWSPSANMCSITVAAAADGVKNACSQLHAREQAVASDSRPRAPPGAERSRPDAFAASDMVANA